MKNTVFGSDIECCGSAYRYHFNGKESDNDWTGNSGDSYDFGARMYDTRLGRWLTIDPLYGKHPSYSSYSYVKDNPIIYVDPNGETDYYAPDGTWIGSNGTDDGTKTVVNDADIRKEIVKSSKKGINYTTTIPEDKVYVLPCDKALQQAVDIFAKTVQNKGGAEFSVNVDKEGNPTGEVYKGAEYVPGDRTAGGGTTADFPTPNPDKSDISIHSHPTKVWEQNGIIYSHDATKPSPRSNEDVAVFADNNVNIIVGKEGDITTESEVASYKQFGDTRRNVMAFFDSQANLKAVYTIDAVRKFIAGPSGKIYDTYKKKGGKSEKPAADSVPQPSNQDQPAPNGN